MGKSSARYGVDYAIMRTHVSLETPYLVNLAAKKAGFGSMSEWWRDRLATLLAEELGEDRDALLAEMPKSWRENPGAVRLVQPDKSSE